MKILITGTAGFIGFHLAEKLISKGEDIVGIDNINDYYGVDLKYARLAEAGVFRQYVGYGKMVSSTKHTNYRFCMLDLKDKDGINNLFDLEQFDVVCNLAAQAGVRYSLENPDAYIGSNIVGFVHLLEAMRRHPVKHFVYASSSSVYGNNKKQPFSTSDNVDYPVSLYAASKKANELITHSYSHLFGIPSTGLRFFTVYGPWGRPDMAYFIFTKNILENKPIDVFNNGKSMRDFTYIDDIIDGIEKLIYHPPLNRIMSEKKTESNSETSLAPYKIYNIGNSKPISLAVFIETIENRLGLKAKKNMLAMQAGDVLATWADVQDLKNDYGYTPKTDLEHGIDRFISWYEDYYKC